MWTSRRARRLTAVSAIALGLEVIACLGPGPSKAFEAPRYVTFSIELATAASFETLSDARRDQPSEPFGSALSPPVKGGLQDKWSAVKKKLPRERSILL